MLDFFLIEEGVIPSDSSVDLSYLGGFEFDEFRNMIALHQKADELGITLDFFKDFGLKRKEIEVLYGHLKRLLDKEKYRYATYKKIIEIFAKVLEMENMEIFCYCD